MTDAQKKTPAWYGRLFYVRRKERGSAAFCLQRLTLFDCSKIEAVSISIVRSRADDQAEKEERAADFESVITAALFVTAVAGRFGPVMVLRLRRR